MWNMVCRLSFPLWKSGTFCDNQGFGSSKTRVATAFSLYWEEMIPPSDSRE